LQNQKNKNSEKKRGERKRGEGGGDAVYVSVCPHHPPESKVAKQLIGLWKHTYDNKLKTRLTIKNIHSK
jgi:hypothetical protein